MSALSTHDVVYNVSAGRHIAICGLAMGYVHDVVEKKGFAMLTSEILKDSVAEEDG